MCIVCVVPRQVKLQQFLSKLVDKFVARLHRWVCTHLWGLSCALVQLLEAIALALHGSSNLNAAYMHIRMIASHILALCGWCVSVPWSAMSAPPPLTFLAGSGLQSQHGCRPPPSQSSSQKRTLMRLLTVSSRPPGSACSAGLGQWKLSTCSSNLPLCDLRRSSLAS